MKEEKESAKEMSEKELNTFVRAMEKRAREGEDHEAGPFTFGKSKKGEGVSIKKTGTGRMILLSFTLNDKDNVQEVLPVQTLTFNGKAVWDKEIDWRLVREAKEEIEKPRRRNR